MKMDLVLNNLQRLICHKTQATNQQPLTGYDIRSTFKWSSAGLTSELYFSLAWLSNQGKSTQSALLFIAGEEN